MKNASVRDLHIRTSELMKEAAGGSVIVIERRGEPVAESRPLTTRPKPKLPNMTHFWTGCAGRKPLSRLAGESAASTSVDCLTNLGKTT